MRRTRVSDLFRMIPDAVVGMVVRGLQENHQPKKVIKDVSKFGCSISRTQVFNIKKQYFDKRMRPRKKEFKKLCKVYKKIRSHQLRSHQACLAHAYLVSFTVKEVIKPVPHILIKYSLQSKKS